MPKFIELNERYEYCKYPYLRLPLETRECSDCGIFYQMKGITVFWHSLHSRWIALPICPDCILESIDLKQFLETRPTTLHTTYFRTTGLEYNYERA